VQRTVQASALAVIESNYAWAAADSTRVGEHALTPDVPDYQILNFGQLKIMEQLASERGIPAAGFFCLAPSTTGLRPAD